MSLAQFEGRHAGQTLLIVGNGPNLKLTPPEWFNYPSFGMNTIHEYEGWRPTYYAAVDRRVWKEFGQAINEKYAEVDKFIPRPNLSDWQGEKLHYFYVPPGRLWPNNRERIWNPAMMMKRMVYANITHIVIKLAYFMGAKTILIIGMEHKPHAANIKFWGEDTGMPQDPPLVTWLEGYRQLREGLDSAGVKLINISQNTYVPDDIIPHGNWQDWKN